MERSKPLLLLDNNSLLEVLHQGNYRVQEISFEEVKAIVEMQNSREITRCFADAVIEDLLYRHLDIAVSNFRYAPADLLEPGQDAIVFRLYVTPSETQPSVRTSYGNEATKIQNLYVYCQFITRDDPDDLAKP
ncbi:DUF1874 domain-containing protein [Anaerofilum sp. BX8]|uniref:DUF1874 domain-containing protein n=1 Tax=Anaerofilum hominis TaxID=2763016 RepID=A0A923I7C0_9FIRM|nr:DUF1874 domain-containing protein [Anaerofilum hominis]MBC5581620.1 DUF1874 domain-containing protein [Anaerofilum hominis]